MCGIAGIWRFKEKVQIDEIRSFTDSMLHRGPDGAGYEVCEKDNLALGHRRLSILDLSDSGKQPMYGLDNRFCITYNGEVYNFIEIKKELESCGFSFKTETDTEIILAAFYKWGNACFKKFNGMWAMAIWDDHEKTLLLCRDRFGVKPLHYTFEYDKHFAFASETLAFRYLNGHKQQLNADRFVNAIQDMATVEAMGYTIYEKVFQLLPGHLLKITKNTTQIKQERWWHTYDNLVPVPDTYNQQVEQFNDLFQNACKIRMRSDVPLASALSGGVDSSSVYCMLHHLMSAQGSHERAANNWQKAFVGIFPNTTVDEKKYADEVINYIGVPPVYVPPDYTNLADDIVRYTKQMDAITNTPITVVSDIYKAMHKSGIVVSMDGHGADELMFGYVNSIKEVYYQAEIDKDKEFADDILTTYLETLFQDVRVKEKEALVKRGELIVSFEKRLLAQSPAKKMLKRSLAALKAKPVLFNNAFYSSDWFPNLKQPLLKSLSDKPYNFSGMRRDDLELALDFHLTDIPYNLRDFDRGAMFNSVEIRMPFMDYRLVSFLFSLPTKSKIGHGYTKRILRDAMKGKMPESIRTRKLKIGLGAPIDVWFNHELKELLCDSVNSEKFKSAPYWNSSDITSFVNSKIKNKSMFSYEESAHLWNVLNGYLLL
jgi:asparagine synthase (glutamine-hydrolysing)